MSFTYTLCNDHIDLSYFDILDSVFLMLCFNGYSSLNHIQSMISTIIWLVRKVKTFSLQTNKIQLFLNW